MIWYATVSALQSRGVTVITDDAVSATPPTVPVTVTVPDVTIVPDHTVESKLKGSSTARRLSANDPSDDANVQSVITNAPVAPAGVTNALQLTVCARTSVSAPACDCPAGLLQVSANPAGTATVTRILSRSDTPFTDAATISYPDVVNTSKQTESVDVRHEVTPGRICIDSRGAERPCVTVEGLTTADPAATADPAGHGDRQWHEAIARDGEADHPALRPRSEHHRVAHVHRDGGPMIRTQMQTRRIAQGVERIAGAASNDAD
jgi:hypothetical protein